MAGFFAADLPLEQVAFLRRLVSRQLGVSTRAYDMTARLTVLGTLPGGWAVHGKSGTGYRVNGERGGPDLHRQIGWFIGLGVPGRAYHRIRLCH